MKIGKREMLMMAKNEVTGYLRASMEDGTPIDPRRYVGDSQWFLDGWPSDAKFAADAAQAELIRRLRIAARMPIYPAALVTPPAKVEQNQ